MNDGLRGLIRAGWAGPAPDLVMTGLLLSGLLAVILVPKLMTARERTRVAKTRICMRETAMALDAYFVDHESFPPSGTAAGGGRHYESQQIWQPLADSSIDAGVMTANSFSSRRSGAFGLVTFRLPGAHESFHTLTTPVPYLENGLHHDPFASTRGAALGYFAHASRLGWILFSMGPDRDGNAAQGPGDISPRVETLYDLVNHFPYMWEPPPALIDATYDPTNGTESNGDVYLAGGN